MSCDQCQALTINGVYCHELGCPEARPQHVKPAVLIGEPDGHMIRGLFSEIANSADLCAQASGLYVRQVERAADRLEAQAAKLRALVSSS